MFNLEEGVYVKPINIEMLNNILKELNVYNVSKERIALLDDYTMIKKSII